MRAFLSVFCLQVALLISAQSGLTFEVVDHDFGEIREEDGYAEYTFNFVNNGTEPIRVSYVKASCGCTTPGWTKEEVMPGDSGYVKARYNPRNRPGRFRKSLRITTTDPASNKTLYIMGFVKPKPKTPEEEFPVRLGDLRLKRKTLNIGKITNERSIIKTFDVYNDGDSAATLSVDDLIIPEHISLRTDPESLEPKAFGKLVVEYDPVAKADYGFVSDNIVEKAGEATSLSVMAVIEEYFPEMTADELDNAPKLEIGNATFDIGSVKAGTILETSFELTNIGNEKLELRAIKSNCDCVTYEIKNKGIKKGKSLTLEVKFDTSGMRGNQYKSLTVFSNDPVRPTQLINLRGKVEK